MVELEDTTASALFSAADGITVRCLRSAATSVEDRFFFWLPPVPHRREPAPECCRLSVRRSPTLPDALISPTLTDCAAIATCRASVIKRASSPGERLPREPFHLCHVVQYSSLRTPRLSVSIFTSS